MDIHLPELLRDRRTAAAEETVSTADLAIYGRGSIARTRGATAGRFDSLGAAKTTVILHQTPCRSFTAAANESPSQSTTAFTPCRFARRAISAYVPAGAAFGRLPEQIT